MSDQRQVSAPITGTFVCTGINLAGGQPVPEGAPATPEDVNLTLAAQNGGVLRGVFSIMTDTATADSINVGDKYTLSLIPLAP